MAPNGTSLANGHSSAKKPKKDKSDSEKKRRQEHERANDERPHKKSRSKSSAHDSAGANGSPKTTKKSASISYLTPEIIPAEDMLSDTNSRSPSPPPHQTPTIQSEDSSAKRKKDRATKHYLSDENAPRQNPMQEKDRRKEKKKHNGEKDATETPHKSKIRHKLPEETLEPVNNSYSTPKPKKSKSENLETKTLEAPEAPSRDVGDDETGRSSKRKHKDKHKDKESKRRKERDASLVHAMDLDPPSSTPVMPLSAKKSTASGSATTTSKRSHRPLPSEQAFPFFTQTVSQYVPVYPIGWDSPVTAATKQHLQPLLNRYVPSFHGVLLAYRNVVINDQPSRSGGAAEDEEACQMSLVNEYAPGYVYLTAEVDLFMPKRGAWMEGRISLQTEGHVGLVCWGRFNASIEASRLPEGYRWVEFGSREAQQFAHGDDVEVPSSIPPEQDVDMDDDDAQSIKQMHTTGFWITNHGRKFRGKARFRIRSFDVGVSGEHAFLSIEGTMLDDAGERALEVAAAEKAQRLFERKGISRATLRQVPEFSVTKFSREKTEEPPSKDGFLSSRAGSDAEVL